MHAIGVVLLGIVVAYVATGLIVGLVFVSFGATRALPRPAPVSIGARVLLFPGSVALWPIVLIRWLKAEAPR
jgi:hypothetical protein